MADFAAKRYSIDSALEFVADHWEAETPDSVLFRGASAADRVTLAPGLLDAGNNPVTITHITQGLIDEYEIVITPRGITGRVRGRDQAALLLDGYVNVSFTSGPQASLIVRTDPLNVFTETLVGGPGVGGSGTFGFDPAQVVDTLRVGTSSAKRIAESVASVVGLTLKWEVRDYELVKSFQASGRVVDVIRKLVEPWTLVEPFKADVYLQGTTVVVRHRQLPTAPLTADSAHQMTVAATRRALVTVRKRKFKKIGRVRLRGRGAPEGLGTAGGVFVSGFTTIEYRNEQFNKAGALIQRTVIRDTFRVPDRILTQSIKTTYTKGDTGDLIMSARETIVNDWEASIYVGAGPVNQPKQKGQDVTREILDIADKAFRVDAQEATTYTYDDVSFLTGESTLVRKFDKTAQQLVNSTLTIKTVHDVGSLLAEQIVDQYTWDPTNTAWILQQRTSSVSGGHRPGGPGRGLGKAGILHGSGSAYQQVTLESVFSTDLDAQPVEYANENLTLPDLQFIMQQFAAAVGLFEYEYVFDGVGMPWFKRGAVIKFVNVLAEDGVTPIILPPALITVLNAAYDESKPRADFILRAHAFGWAPT